MPGSSVMDRTLFYFVGRPFSPLYCALMRFRESLYRSRIFRVNRVGVPVISVGNLTLGGTGKTPVVQYIARMLQGQGRRPAIISRGYMGKAGSRVNIVSDGSSLLLDARQAGDEPRFLAETLQGVPVLTGAARTHPARKAVEHGSDILILDDGFQHLALARDIDLVLFHADSLAGNSRVFPGGDLREPVKALNRSHAFILTNTSDRNRERAGRFADLLSARFPGRPVFFAEYTPTRVVFSAEGSWDKEAAIDEIKRKALFAFAGIASPERFEQTLNDLSLHLCGFMGLADHQRYGKSNLGEILRQAKEAGAEACITTEKDMVKLKAIRPSMPIYALRMEARLGKDFHEFMTGRLKGAR
jgi:tetraacyldisaccharide 4'-kinase